MKLRSFHAVILLAAISAVALFAVYIPAGSRVAAQDDISVVPDGGGEFEFAPVDEITEEQRDEINAHISANVAMLRDQGRLEAAKPEVVLFSWPVRKTAGFPDFAVDAISNYVDQNPAFPNLLLDWNCGTRTYDQNSGYNHKGIDIFTWPFSWKKMDDGAAEVVAGAPGTIVFKSDGNFDRQCGFGGGNWNAVYVRHADNSVAWYGHMKNGSLTTKAVGSTVVEGEKLGIVGSSGNSTGPHLHFELYDSNNQLQDPFAGPCNTKNNFSWWANQEPYRVPRINRLMTGAGGPSFGSCPTTETTNERTLFQPGSSIAASAYYRDQQAGQVTQYSLIGPDGVTQQSWTHTSPNSYSASYWFFTRQLPADAPFGVWTLRAVHNGTTYDQPFTVGNTATVAGQVITPDGRGLRNTIVELVDPQGVTRRLLTTSFGDFTFTDLPVTAGKRTVRVLTKRYTFTSKEIAANDNATSLMLVGDQ